MTTGDKPSNGDNNDTEQDSARMYNVDDRGRGNGRGRGGGGRGRGRGV